MLGGRLEVCCTLRAALQVDVNCCCPVMWLFALNGSSSNVIVGWCRCMAVAECRPAVHRQKVLTD